MTVDGIKRIETNPDQRPHQRTLDTIREVFASNGVEFTPNSVKLVDNMVRVFEGDDAYMQMMDDVLATTAPKGGEVLFLFSDDRAARPGEVEIEERIRANSARLRVLIEQGNNFYRWSVDEYCQIPAQYFNHDLQVIYGDKVAQLVAGGKKL